MIKTIINSLKNKRISKVNGFYVVTDKVDYNKHDQVFPLHPENQFYLDEINNKIKNAKVLEIGLGSGVLSIGAIKAGAKNVVGLEINPRAKMFAGYNLLINNCEDRIEIRNGNVKDIFKSVKGERFDYIISNPPFEPTPPSVDYYLHSSGGIYGLDFVEKIFKDLDNYLSNNGCAQIVTFAPGNEKEPFMLIDLSKKYLNGKTIIKVNPVSMKFNDFVDRFVEIGLANKKQIKLMKKVAEKDGISHLYLCMVHYKKGLVSIKTEPSKKQYKKWDLPIDSDVPMGYSEVKK